MACGGTRRSNGRRRPRSGGAPWVCMSASECGVEAVAVRVLGDGGRTHGGACVRDMARPWRTAERPLARRRGYRAGGGRGRCPGGRRAHPKRVGVLGVVGGGRWRSKFGEDDRGERRPNFGRRARLAQCRASQQACDGGGGKGRHGGARGFFGLSRGGRSRRRCGGARAATSSVLGLGFRGEREQVEGNG